MSVRADLLAAYRAGIAAVDGRRAVAEHLKARPLSAGAVSVVALGKAAAGMLQGALEVLGPRTERALVVTREGYGAGLPTDPRIRLMESAHPLPDERSIAAGRALVEFIGGLPRDRQLLVLISGGASSLVELPVAGLDAGGLAAINRRLLAEGHDIGTINSVRKALSRIKGGRLARWISPRPTRVLAISDVPGNDPATIGSGLLAADGGARTVPESLRPLLAPYAALAEPAPTPGDPVLARIETDIVADNACARRAAADCLQQRGYAVECSNVFLDGDVETVADTVVRRLGPGADGRAVVWGGEPTVRLPENPGRGGRMQALAATVAWRLRGVGGWALCAAGTDGADGATEHAGAMVDGGTARRAHPHALDACCAEADTAACLEQAGDVVDTGPTGTNVMDLVIGYAPSSGT